MGAAVVPAELDRVDDLAAVLGRAFADDEMIRWKLRADVGPEEIADTFRAIVAAHVEIGTLREIDGGHGVSGWLPAALLDRFEELVVPVGRASALPHTDDGGARYDAFWEWIVGHTAPEGSWYLDFVAVDPAAQGRGFGVALVREGMDRAFAENAPVSLTTETASNVGFYERLGFHVVDEGDAPLGGPHMWFMQADPG